MYNIFKNKISNIVTYLIVYLNIILFISFLRKLNLYLGIMTIKMYEKIIKNNVI